MSRNHLDMVETFDQFGHDQWKALATKLGGVDAVKAVLRGTSAVSVKPIRCIGDLSTVTIGGGKCNPHEFFQIRKGLYMWGSFLDSILSATTNKVITTKKATLGYANLAQPANDDEIAVKMPKNYIFEDVDVFLGNLATLINTQKDGGEGWLLNNEYWNIFYVRVGHEVFTVIARWYSDYSDYSDYYWDCRAYHPIVNRWNTDNRVFSATAEL